MRRHGWRPGASGIVYRGQEGHWGHVWFMVGPNGDALSGQLVAGANSPYLMRTVNKIDPDSPPPAGFIALHARVCPGVRVHFRDAVEREPASLDTGRLNSSHPDVHLDEACAPSWIETTFATLAPAVASLCSDVAIRDWLIDEQRPDGSFTLRYAVLLTRHLGLEDQMEPLLARAERARAAEIARARARELHPRSRHDDDDQDTYPQDWSHQRFLRFLDEIPP